jgi:hypothetical protein
MESTDTTKTKREKVVDFLIPKMPPKVWWGYIIIIPLVYTIIMGMTWVTLALAILLIADRIHIHIRYLMITAAGMHLSRLHHAMYEIGKLTDEVEAEQRNYMAKKMHESEEE